MYCFCCCCCCSLIVVGCCLFYFSFHSLFFPPAHSIGITVHRVAAIRFDILQYKALARVMELANSLNPTNTLTYLYTTIQTHSRKHILRHCTCQKHIILKAISSCMGGGKLLLQVMGKGKLLHNFVVIM